MGLIKGQFEGFKSLSRGRVHSGGAAISAGRARRKAARSRSCTRKARAGARVAARAARRLRDIPGHIPTPDCQYYG
ncbi:unnamed protein product, partial [Iphiclides podalirius]